MGKESSTISRRNFLKFAFRISSVQLFELNYFRRLHTSTSQNSL
jgi:hypothetical protein